MTLVSDQLSIVGLYLPPVFVGQLLNAHPGDSLPPQTIISLPLQIAVGAPRPVGAFAVAVAVQLSALGLYLPPVLDPLVPSNPPQTIISKPVHTAA